MWRTIEARLHLKPPKQPAQPPKSKGTGGPRESDFDEGDFVKAKPFAGHRDGWVYTTGSKGLGYYVDVVGSRDQPHGNGKVTLVLDAAIPVPACTAALMHIDGSLSSLAISHKRATRARLADGRRKKRLTRRQRAAAAQLDDGKLDSICPETALLGDCWWQEFGMWALDTGNANCWKSFKGSYAANSKADVVFGQESKILTSNGIISAENDARAEGWNPSITRAHPTAGDSGSGGCLVLAKKGTGIATVTTPAITEAVSHRLHLAWIDAVVRGGTHCLSVYLRTAEGLTEANMGILEHATAALRDLRGPWIASGDWNINPSTLAGSRWLEQVGGVIFATHLSTCNDNTYDYFVVSKSLAKMVVGVQRLQDAGNNPHWGSRLIVRGDARRHATRQLVRPAKVPAELPMGPATPSPSYEDINRLAVMPTSLGQAMDQWYSQARREFSAIAGEDLRHKPAVFKWAQPFTKVMQPQAGSTSVSSLWRNLSMRADETIRMLARTQAGCPTPKGVLQHSAAAKLAAKTLCNSLRADIQPQVDAWAAAFDKAVAAGSLHWLASLHTVAKIKAAKLEAQVAAARLKEWKQRLGAIPSEQGGFKRPTKAAYRWLRGPTGWQPSQIGSISQNDDVPMAGDDFFDCDNEEEALIPVGGQVSTDAKIPLSDQAMVNLEAEKWASLWLESEDYVQPEFGVPPDALAELMPNAISLAANSFPMGTGLGADNISPRAISRLSAAAILALATIFMAFETNGSWCEALNLVLIVLLPKSDGGLRPIGLFPTVIRIWFRSRIGLARAWEHSHCVPGVFGGVGSSAQHAAWQAAFVAESAALSSLDHVQGLLDLVKAFETVPHFILVLAARAKGYPIVIIRLSLAAYRLKRTVGIDGVYSRTIVATRGITAGSGFATSELKVLLQDLMEALHLNWAGIIVVKLFVDDLTLSAIGLPQVVVRNMIRVLDFVIHHLEVLLRMLVSDTKSKVLSGRPHLAAAVAEGIQSKKVGVTTHAKLLGTDSVGGRKRSTQVAQQRLVKFTTAIPRFQSLRRVGVNSKQMVRAAGPPGTCHPLWVRNNGRVRFYAADHQIQSRQGRLTSGRREVPGFHLVEP